MIISTSMKEEIFRDFCGLMIAFVIYVIGDVVYYIEQRIKNKTKRL